MSFGGAPCEGWRFPRNRAGRPLVVAHRGEAFHAPENTFAAFTLALEAGADMLELDVQRTRDGELVVLHDRYLDRTTSGRGAVSDLTAREIGRLDAGAWFSPAFAGERVPPLEEVVAWARGRAGLLVELKMHPSLDPPVDGALAALLARTGFEHVVVYSADHEAIRRLARRCPDLAVGISVNAHTHHALRLAREVGARLLSQEPAVLTPTTVAEAHAAGGLVSSGVRHELQVSMLLDWGVDLLVTDRIEVARLREIVDGITPAGRDPAAIPRSGA